MAEVYKVKTIGLAGFEKVQALKRIRPHYAREPRFIRSFVDEARIAVELSHRNIVQVFDFGKAGGELYLAMELIDGIDLRTASRDARRRKIDLPVAIACYILGEVGAGLDYAHRKSDANGEPLGIVHCDVSPPNVMLSYEGYVKILDFGVARARFSAHQQSRRLRGKPRYMAPEQTRGLRPTPATDVFALGIIAWEMLTGLPLFEGRDLHAILEAVRRVNAPSPDKLNPDVPAIVAETVARALSPEPEDRGSSIDFAVVMQRTAQLYNPRANARSLSDWLHRVYSDRQPSRAPSAPDLDSESAQNRLAEPTTPERERINRLMAAVQADNPDSSEFGEPTTPERERPALSRPGRPPLPESGPVTEDDFMTAETRTLDTGELAAIRDREDRGTRGERSIAEGSVDQSPSDQSVGDQSVGDQSVGDQLSSAERALVLSGLQVTPTDQRRPALPTGPTRTLIHTVLDVVDSIDEPSEPLRLREKRRVVAVAVLLEGSADTTRHETIRLLGDLAYKRGGVAHEEDLSSLIVIFGLEVAGEDDVASAMGYALDAVQIGRDAQAAGSEDLAVRIAARAGIVASVGSAGGYHLVGDALEETRALARGAEPGRPLLSGGAGRLTSMYYAFRELPARRHRSRRLRVLELLGPRSFDERARALQARKGRFFGRDREINQLSQALQQAIDNDRQIIVALTGPSGVGKSRLIAEFVARANRALPEPSLVAVAATPGGRTAPFSLVIELVQAALNLPPGRGEAARGRLTQRTRHVLQSRGIEARDIDDVVGALELGMELRDGAPLAPVQTSEDINERLWGALRTLRGAISNLERPLILVVEDLHLADAGSAEILRRGVVHSGQGAELLILTTASDQRSASDLADWVDRVIDVGALPASDLQALVRDRMGAAAADSDVRTLVDRAGGNPLLVEQLALEVRDAGVIPPTARAMITARVDRLSPAAKGVLQHASVAGHRFRPRLLEELFDRDIAPELDELCAEALVHRDDGGAASSHEGELAFAGGLIREVIYESLSASARRETHARLGDLLSARFRAGRDEPPGAIAEHFERGDRPSAASAFWLRAARVALAAGDATAAIERFSRTLAIESKRPDNKRSDASRARQREALSGRALANGRLGEHDAQQRDLEQLEAIAWGDPVLMAEVKNRMAVRLLRLGDYQGAIAAAEDAQSAAEESGEERDMGESLRIRGEAYERSGEYERSLDMTGRARAIFQRIGAVADETKAMIGTARTYLVLNRFEDARTEYDAIVERVLESGDTWLERTVRNHLAVIHVCLGELEQAMESIERAIAICQRYNDHAREGDCLSVGGTILMYMGCYERARAYFHNALSILEQTDSRWSRADCLVYAGANEAHLGAYDEAFAYLRQSMELSETIGARYVQANVWANMASAFLARNAPGDVRRARDAADKAVHTARDTSLVGLEIQGLSRLAEATWKSGDLTRAVELSTKAIDLLDQERYIEGSEEELLYTHYRLLKARGDPAAASILARARESLDRKLAAIATPEWRQAFTESVPANAAILAE